MKAAKVVVTAAGVISPLGAGLEEFACALYAGRSAIAKSTRFPGLPAADLGDFQPQPWLGKKGIRALDRSARMLAVAAQMALVGADLLQPEEQAGDPGLGLVCGTAFGVVHSIASFDWSGLNDGPSLVNPTEFPNTVINSPAGHTAIKHKLRGVNSTVCGGFASGLFAIDCACDFLRFGRGSALLAGGVEELCEESALGFRKLKIVSGSGRPQPFALDRDGTAPGEGAALWMLEREDSALSRGQVPWLEICGFGSFQETQRMDEFEPHGRGAAQAMRHALSDACVEADELACIVTSANGSVAGDAMEERALRCVFGDWLPEIPLCAPKAAFGEAAGASGALSAIVAGLALQQQKLPPTVGGTRYRTGLRLSGKSESISGNYALVNSFGCDGNNASLVIRLWQN